LAKGKTISVTLPNRVVEFYDGRAKEIGMSRSALLCNIVMADYEKKLIQEREFVNVSGPVEEIKK